MKWFAAWVTFSCIVVPALLWVRARRVDARRASHVDLGWAAEAGLTRLAGQIGSPGASVSTTRESLPANSDLPVTVEHNAGEYSTR
jgi:hypothetical protein